MISIDEIGTKLTDIIESYTDKVKEGLEHKLDKTADEILSYITSNAPRSDSGSNHLADSFVKTEVGSGVNKTVYISSKTKGPLVHLIELGFRHVSGKHIPARPFLRPAYDAFAPQMLEDIKKIIENGGK